MTDLPPPPTAISGFDSIGSTRMYYYGANPATLHTLPIGAWFSVVYSNPWRVIRYRVVAGKWPQKERAHEPCPNAYAVEMQELLSDDEAARYEAYREGEAS